MKLSQSQLREIDDFLEKAEQIADEDILYRTSISDLETRISGLLEGLGLDQKRYFKRLK